MSNRFRCVPILSLLVVCIGTGARCQEPNIAIIGFGLDDLLGSAQFSASLGIPILNDRGDATMLVHEGALVNNHPVVRDAVIWTDGSGFKEVAHVSQRVPDSTAVFSSLAYNSSYNSSRHLLLRHNNNGDVAFAASIYNEAASQFTEGIFISKADELVQIAPRPLAEFSGSVVRDGLSDIALDDAGHVAFLGTIVPSDAGAANIRGVFYTDQNQVLTIAIQGDMVEAVGSTLYRIYSPAIVGDRQVVLFASTPESGPFNFVVSGDENSLVRVAGLDQIAPDGASVLQPINDDDLQRPPAVNNQGESVFRVTFRREGQAVNRGIVLARDVGLEMVAERLSGNSDIVLEAFNDSPTINNVGQVAFKAYGSAPSDGSMPISGVFRSTEGRLETIAVEGLQDPSGKGHFVSFERPSINDHGQVVFMGAVELPESNEVHIGIYFYDDEMGLTQVVQPGDEIAGKRIRHVAAELYGFQANLFDSGFNQFGQVGFRFTLEDGQIGSAIWSPYPSGDFTADGVVDQADLDLVLLSWGSPFEQLGAGWHSNPPGAFVDQRELDHVLLNWGTTTSPRIASGSIPEPSGWSIALCICPFWLACAGARRTNQVALGGRSILY